MSYKEASVMSDRQYRVVWVRDDKSTRGVHCPGPFTHEEACTVLRKLAPHAKRRDLLEQIHANDPTLVKMVGYAVRPD